MDKKMYNRKYNHNRYMAWKYFECHGFAEHSGLVLHHKDVNMKKKDPERYAEWRITDLQIMTVQEHRKLHMAMQTKGKKHTKTHNANISKGMREHMTIGKIVKVSIEAREAKTLYFKSFAAAARFLGCTRQLVSQVLRDGQGNLRAKGYKIELVDKENN